MFEDLKKQNVSRLMEQVNKIEQKRYWYALYTRPRFEKKVDLQLKELDIQTFLPIRTVTKYWSDRKKKIDEPLFPSYLFVYTNSKEQYLTFQTYGSVRLVSFNGTPTRIPDEQIHAVRRVLESGYTPIVNHYFVKGDEVEIVSGPLVGIKGFVIEHRGSNHFSVFISGIRQAVAVNIEAHNIKLIAR